MVSCILPPLRRFRATDSIEIKPTEDGELLSSFERKDDVHWFKKSSLTNQDWPYTVQVQKWLGVHTICKCQQTTALSTLNDLLCW